MPVPGRRPIPGPRKAPVVKPPLAGLKPQFGDRNDGKIRIVTLLPDEVTPEIAAFLADPDVMEGWNMPRKEMGLEAFRAYVASFDHIKRSLMAIREFDSNRPVGIIVFNIDHRHRSAGWHMCIGKAEDRGQQIGVRAGTLGVRHAFEDRKVEKLSFEFLARNKVAIGVAEKYGIQREAVLRKHRVDALTGERIDEHVYGMMVEEYWPAIEALGKAGMLPPFEGPGIRPLKR